MTQRLRIDIVSDVVCPWCVIGYRQLRAALDAAGMEAAIHWHPFQLNPHMAAEGENLREHLMAKYGMSVADSQKARDRLTELGAELGFTFDYSEDMWTYNTFLAHQLIHWAGLQGKAHEMKMALFGAFFTDRKAIGDIDVLAQLAGTIGLDEADAREALVTQAHGAGVRKNAQFWVDQGIQGVPAMVFDEKYLVTGAQGIDNYSRIIAQVVAQRAA